MIGPHTAGASVLDQTHGFISRFVAMPSPAALDLVTVWVAHTHVRTADRLAFHTTPRLYVGSDEPQSGKSMVLDMVRLLSYNGRTMLDATPHGFVTMLTEQQSSVVLDEIDILFGAGNAKRVLVSLLNGGYRYGESWVRNGKESSVFGAVALGGLSAKFRTAQALAPLRQRCISIEMVPATPPEEYDATDHEALGNAYRADLTAWAKRHTPAIVAAKPEDIPPGITARLKEVARPLFAVADAAGGDWPERIRAAARELMLGQSEQPEDVPIADQLLADVLRVFADREAVKLPTIELVDGLYALPKSVWLDMWPQATGAPRNLAAMLRPMGVEPRSLDIDGHTHKGYHLAELETITQLR